MMVTANPKAIAARKAEANLRPDAKGVMVKLVTITDIMNAATLLSRHGLIPDAPHMYVRRYIEANPDINEAIAEMR